jgi:hypothetical protein
MTEVIDPFDPPIRKQAGFWGDFGSEFMNQANQNSAKQWWNMPAHAISGIGRVAEGSRQFTGGTPWGNVDSEWRPSEMSSGARDIASGSFTALNSTALGGAGAGMLGRLGIKGLGKIGIGKGVPKFMGKFSQFAPGQLFTPGVGKGLINTAYNPMAFAKNIGGTGRLASALRGWGQRAAGEIPANSMGSWFKNRAAVLGSSVLGAGNMIAMSDNDMLMSDYEKYGGWADTQGRPSQLNAGQRFVGNLADNLPWLMTRGFLPGTIADMQQPQWTPDGYSSIGHGLAGGYFKGQDASKVPSLTSGLKVPARPSFNEIGQRPVLNKFERGALEQAMETLQNNEDATVSRGFGRARYRDPFLQGRNPIQMRNNTLRYYSRPIDKYLRVDG